VLVCVCVVCVCGVCVWGCLCVCVLRRSCLLVHIYQHHNHILYCIILIIHNFS